MRDTSRLSCSWDLEGKKARGGVSRSYAAKLEERIKELESGAFGSAERRIVRYPHPPINELTQTTFATDDSRNTQGTLLRTVSIDPTQISDPPSTVDQHSTEVRGQSQTSGQALSQHSVPPAPQSLPGPEIGNSEAVNAMIGAVLDEPDIRGYFGGSSVGSFMQQVRKVIDTKLDNTASTRSASDYELSTTTAISPAPRRKSRSISSADFTLPLRTIADSLFAVYWDNVHPLYPFLDRQETEADYQNVWLGRELISDEALFHCVLNSIFAISTQLNYSTKNGKRELVADTFFQRAKRCLDMWDTGSLQSIQAFLLLGQFLQSTNEPQDCWTCLGLAARTAQSLGFHLPETSESIPALRTRELVRRVWHGCILMDRIAAMTYGRPTMIPKILARSVPLPIAADEQYVPNEGAGSAQQREHSMATMHFYGETLKLGRLLYEILTHFYLSDQRQIRTVDDLFEHFLGASTTNATARSILDVDRDLTIWQQSLPQHLKILDNGITGSPRNRLAVVLRQR
jgi:Fungal specific transcription factor domain